MKSFKDIIAWQKAYQLTLLIYKVTANFPKSEEYGLKNQIRRAAVSVISNIAEGFKKSGLKERLYFYKISQCSLEEEKCQSMLSFDLGYINSTNYLELSKLEMETSKILFGWIKSQK